MRKLIALVAAALVATAIAFTANAFAKTYVEENLERRIKASDEALHWLSKRIVSQRQKLEESETALQAYREKFKMTAEPTMQLLLLAWAFSAFLQGVAGFGVPIAVVAPLLIGLGFAPVVAVAAVAIGHSWSVTFGDIASSFNALIATTGLTGWELAPWSGAFLGIACLCCGLAAATFNPEQAPVIRQRNLDDALEAGTEALCYLCPMCRRGLADAARDRGLAGYHIVELARMALGELPVPA